MADCKHGLDDAWCSICLHGPTKPDTGDGFAADGFTFPAKYGGHCRACNLPIHAGQPIIRTTNAEYVHIDCATVTSP